MSDLVEMLIEDAQDLEQRSNGGLPYMVDNMREAADVIGNLKSVLWEVMNVLSRREEGESDYLVKMIREALK